MPFGGRGSDWAFFAYFLFQIPSTLVFDSQGVYPEWLYPGWAKGLRVNYLSHVKDPFLGDAWKYPWYLSFCLVEHFIEFPFFVWAAYAYYHGSQARPGVVLPSLVYGIHTVTVVVAVWMAVLFSNFNTEDPIAPKTTGERIRLCSAYLPFFIFSAWMAIVCGNKLKVSVKRD